MSRWSPKYSTRRYKIWFKCGCVYETCSVSVRQAKFEACSMLRKEWRDGRLDHLHHLADVGRVKNVREPAVVRRDREFLDRLNRGEVC